MTCEPRQHSRLIRCDILRIIAIHNFFPASKTAEKTSKMPKIGKSMKLDLITFCGYVPRPSGGSQGRNIASSISKYAPTNLFWCVEHFLSSWCSAGTRWKTSKIENAKTMAKPPRTAPSGYVKNGYVLRPSGGSRGRGIASNLSKYAPIDLFWCIEHLLSAWCSAGTCWKTSNMRKTRKNRLPQPSGYVKTAMSHGLLGVPKAAALLQTCQNMPPLTCFDV